jgi:hypothetical protein
MAFLAPIGMAVGGWAGAAGVGLAAWSSYQEGRINEANLKSQAAMAEYNAQMQEREAQAARDKASLESRRRAEAGSRRQSSMLASIGASGVVPTEGTPLLIQAKQAAEDEFDMLLAGYEGEVQAQRHLSQAAADRMEAKYYKKNARYARDAGILGAGTTLLSGFGNMDFGGTSFMNKSASQMTQKQKTAMATMNRY